LGDLGRISALYPLLLIIKCMLGRVNVVQNFTMAHPRRVIGTEVIEKALGGAIHQLREPMQSLKALARDVDLGFLAKQDARTRHLVSRS
jgi:hypothetical protein